VVVIALLAVAFSDNRFFRLLDEQLENVWYGIYSEERVERRIAVIEIDDRTLENYFPEIPLPRDQIALLINELAGPRGNARTIVIDLYFEGQDKVDPLHDTLLAGILSIHGEKVVNAMYLPIGGERQLPLDSTQRALLQRFGYDVAGPLIPPAEQTNLPLPIFLSSSQYYGHIGVVQVETQIPRQIPPFVGLGGIRIGALSLEGVRNYLRLDKSDVSFENGFLSLGDHNIPINRNGVMNIRYFRNTEGYERYSMLELLENLKSEKMPVGFLSDKIVVIGVNSMTYYPKEISFTPYGNVRPNMYLHADLMSNILNDHFLKEVSSATSIYIMIAISLFYVLIQMATSRAFRVIAGASLIIGLFISDLVLFAGGYSLEVVTLVIMSVILSTYTSARTFGEQSRTIREQEEEAVVLREKEKSLSEIKQELKVARAIQENLLPEDVPSIAGYDIHALNIPAKEVSGDFYDFISVSGGGLVMTIGDVSGKGISAAMLMASTQAVIRSEVSRQDMAECDCARIVSNVNAQICASTDASRFVTLFFAFLNPESGEFHYVNAGHNSPLLLESDGKITELESGNLILGVMPDAAYTDREIILNEGKKVVLFTDGIVEADNSNDEMYGQERFEEILKANVDCTAGELTRAIVDDISAFTKGHPQSDDITLLVIAAH
jgi:serine phosphatase RsbU (regulator of sigma subunit)/CHASE2 domain-containing sensor protein